jgi:hypothetical protein
MGQSRGTKGNISMNRYNGILQYYVILWEGKVDKKKLDENIVLVD